MTVRVRASAVGQAEWKAALADCPYATYFHSPAWFGHALRLRPGFDIVVHRLDVGGADVVWPFVERRRGPWWKRRIDRRGNPAGVYGGWLGRQPLDPQQTAAALAWYGGGSSAQVRLNPFHPMPPRDALGGFSWEDDTTSVIDLRRPLEQIVAGYASGQRRNIRAAEKAGVSCRAASTDIDWDAYLRLYDATVARWGASATRTYDHAFLRGLGDLAPAVRLWLAEREGRLGAGIISLEQGGHIVLWHSANDAAENAHSPFKLLIHSILADAHARGLATFDLNPSGRLSGASEWKRLLGAKELPSPVLSAGMAPRPTTPGPASPPGGPGPAGR